jgi:hypothetical protein
MIYANILDTVKNQLSNFILMENIQLTGTRRINMDKKYLQNVFPLLKVCYTYIFKELTRYMKMRRAKEERACSKQRGDCMTPGPSRPATTN